MLQIFVLVALPEIALVKFFVLAEGKMQFGLICTYPAQNRMSFTKKVLNKNNLT